jgi:hypothetical protein
VGEEIERYVAEFDPRNEARTKDRFAMLAPETAEDIAARVNNVNRAILNVALPCRLAIEKAEAEFGVGQPVRDAVWETVLEVASIPTEHYATAAEAMKSLGWDGEDGSVQQDIWDAQHEMLDRFMGDGVRKVEAVV